MIRKQHRDGHGFYGIDRSVADPRVYAELQQIRGNTIEQALHDAANPRVTVRADPRVQPGTMRFVDARSLDMPGDVVKVVESYRIEANGDRVVTQWTPSGRKLSETRQPAPTSEPRAFTPVQTAIGELQHRGDIQSGLLRVYTEYQRDERRGYHLPPAMIVHGANAWSAQLRAKVQASDDKRREADRLQVVVDNSWWDD